MEWLPYGPMDKDYYAILGVHPSAEEAVISAAYRALAKLYHPDLYKGSDAADRMAKINEAYETLSDEEKRKEYDATRSNNLPEDDPIFDNTEYNDEEFFGEDWSLAMEYYPEAAKEAEELAKISTKLAFTYKAFLIDTKSFSKHTAVFERFRKEFLSSYFGKNENLQLFARRLIEKGKKEALLDLNKAVKVLGSSVDPYRVIIKLAHKHGFNYTSYGGIDYDRSVDQQKTTEGQDSWVVWAFVSFCFVLVIIALAAS